MAGSSDQLKEQLKAAQAEEQEAKRLLAVGERVLTRVRDEKNKLQDAHTQLGEELKDVRAQLANSMKENKRLCGGWRRPGNGGPQTCLPAAHDTTYLALGFTTKPSPSALWARGLLSAFWKRGSPDLPACGPQRG